MHNLESALSNAKEKQSMLEKIWPSKSARKEFNVEKILCFVDANQHSSDAIYLSIQLSKEFESNFSIRSLFDKELKKLTSEDLSSLKQSIIEIVKTNLKQFDLNQEVRFLEGDAIESVSSQLIAEYDILVLPIPYHSNLSDHPEAVALGTLGEYLVRESEKPLFLVPSIENLQEDLFQSVIIVANDVSDIIQNENIINAISRNRSHIHFVYLYNEKDIEIFAEASKGVVDVDLVKKRVHEQLEGYGEVTVDRFNDLIESVKYSIFKEDFSDNIQLLIQETSASLLTIILPENKASHRYLLFQEMLRDKKLQLPIMILRVGQEEEESIEKQVLDKNSIQTEDSIETVEQASTADQIDDQVLLEEDNNNHSEN
ncbi:MAG: hypothetical protein ACXAD7_05570 [Candidatus Kariarchaeaceae archaeon]|jgi:hypothetical protein